MLMNSYHKEMSCSSTESNDIVANSVFLTNNNDVIKKCLIYVQNEARDGSVGVPSDTPYNNVIDQ